MRMYTRNKPEYCVAIFMLIKLKNRLFLKAVISSLVFICSVLRNVSMEAICFGWEGKHCLTGMSQAITWDFLVNS
jgi:hypothetical protein